MLFAQPVNIRISLVASSSIGAHTLLKELESIDDTALIAHEEKTSPMLRLRFFFLTLRDFGSELDAATEDSPILKRDRRLCVFKVCTRQRLANVSSKWAPRLVVSLPLKTEVVVPDIE